MPLVPPRKECKNQSLPCFRWQADLIAAVHAEAMATSLQFLHQHRVVSPTARHDQFKRSDAASVSKVL